MDYVLQNWVAGCRTVWQLDNQAAWDFVKQHILEDNNETEGYYADRNGS